MIEVGQTIGNYKITSKLGEGGMGVVYLAEHPVIGRKVALKAIHPELSRNPEVVSRFMTEAKSVNQIGNEHIVDVMDFGTTTEGEFYFIMEYLQGEAVSERLSRESQFEPNRALKVSAQVADALAASHAHGIIHRDLKPENIFLISRGQTRDFVKVLDFGLAKLTQGEEKVSHKTRTGSVMGTPYYMAPEQCEGKIGIDQRADIYSLGVIIFEMMTGKVPFGGEGYGEIIVKHITMAPPSLRGINPTVTAAQEAVVMRALAKKREDRFQSMEEFRAAMLDPDRFAANLPMPVAEPAAEAGGELPPSHRPTMGAGGAHKVAPMPSTFRHGVGELLDDELDVPKSRKGLVAGVVLAVAVAGAAAFFLTRKPEPPIAQHVVPPPAPVAAAPAPPQKVKVSFASDPVGATIVRKDTGQTLGVTPLEAEIPYGKQAVTFVFKKDDYEPKERPLVPEAAGHLDVSLMKKVAPAPPPAPTPPPVAVKPPPPKPVATRPAPPKHSTPPRPRRGSGKPLDEDGVLEPSFK